MAFKDLMADELFNWLCSIRRDIHQWPEPAFEEWRTGGRIAEALKGISVPHRTGIARTGVVAEIEGDPDGPTIALRADMDALPIEERTGLPFSSKVAGYMHACGHDGHIAMLLGAAALLKEARLDGNAVFIFQPAEEREGGALPMIEEGVLDGVDMIFGGHIENRFHTGEIAIKDGVASAYTDSVEIIVKGRGGHAAEPHDSVDAVLVASHLVVSLQSIISREVDPLQPAVLTIGSLHAGTANNVIAGSAVLRGTIRCTDDGTRRTIIESLKRTVTSLAALHGAQADLKIDTGYPSIINHHFGCSIAREAAEHLLGSDAVITLDRPTMGGEDFSYYLQRVPGCFVRFGSRKKGCEYIPDHSPAYEFDEEVIRVGAVFYAEVVKRAIARLRKPHM